jgi:hypothetical protein
MPGVHFGPSPGLPVPPVPLVELPPPVPPVPPAAPLPPVALDVPAAAPEPVSGPVMFVLHAASAADIAPRAAKYRLLVIETSRDRAPLVRYEARERNAKGEFFHADGHTIARRDAKKRTVRKTRRREK